ncbi:peptidoglycan-binding domain-containing protein [Frankia sp. AgB32]|uniref:peptidoglycan-binding domain-containing protein n=1 Tax=Frankia sp. AgB32 TaxID=631119 RepID=UPI00200E8F47|nr:peptidoglycan-binding domain-containing protein [Frankia sp. AgB32]MCK9895074.1 peptidoglycan-binding protein [Frankia sp. AgB32]
MRLGDRNDCVWGVQNALHARGLLPTIDGAFGPGTTAAVRSFQTSSGLNVDGVAGKQTLQALEDTLRDRLLGSLVFRFDRRATQQIARGLETTDGAAAQALTLACAPVKGSLASTVCEFLVPLGTDRVRTAARSAADQDACLAVDLRRVAVRLSSDGGPKCT